ncbi:hypothetical protein D3C73_951090 [compost metagenome]
MGAMQQLTYRLAVFRTAGLQTQQQHRAFCLLDQFDRGANILGRRRPHAWQPAPRQHRRTDRLIDDIHWQTDKRGPRTAELGVAEGVGDHF